MEEFVNMREAAELIGIARKTLQEWFDKGRFDVEPYRLGFRLKWKKSEVLDWIERQRVTK